MSNTHRLYVITPDAWHRREECVYAPGEVWTPAGRYPASRYFEMGIRPEETEEFERQMSEDLGNIRNWVHIRETAGNWREALFHGYPDSEHVAES